MYDVTMRRGRVTIVAAKKQQILRILSVCDMKKLVAAFCNFANAPTNIEVSGTYNDCVLKCQYFCLILQSATLNL
jgi:hypothetical protein